MSTSAYFVTLTYSDEWLPAGATVVPRDMQLFLKRLRGAVAPVRIRYYGVGEYGDRKFRPHYHLALFGLPAVPVGKHLPPCACCLCSSWSQGLVHVGEVTMESAAYIASYTVKKMTRVTDPRLGGRHPEFARMSLRPGIGHGAMRFFKEALVDKNTGEILLRDNDVPSVARVLGRLWPVGRYLRRVLRMASLLREGEGRAATEGRLSKLLAEVAGYPSTREWLEARDKGREIRATRAESVERLNRQKRGTEV